MVPDVSHLRPFMSSGHAKLGREKIKAMRKAKKPIPVSCTGLPVLLLGYQSMYSTTYALLTPKGRVMHSRSAVFDVTAPLGVHRDLVQPPTVSPISVPVTLEFHGDASKEASVEMDAITIGDDPNDGAREEAPLEEAPDTPPLEEALATPPREDIYIQVEDSGLFDAFNPSRIIGCDVSDDNVIEGTRTRRNADQFINDARAQANDTELKEIWNSSASANLVMAEHTTITESLFAITSQLERHSRSLVETISCQP